MQSAIYVRQHRLIVQVRVYKHQTKKKRKHVEQSCVNAAN